MEDNKKWVETKDGKFYKDLTENKWYWEDGREFKHKGSGIRPPWLHGKGFESGTNRNRLGGRRTITKIMEELNSDARVELTKKGMIEIYKTLFATSVGDLKKIQKRDDTPLILATIISNLLDDRTRAKALHEYQTWIFGKAPEEVKITTNTVVSEAEHEAILKVIGDKY